jgi:hypothetical protein
MGSRAVVVGFLDGLEVWVRVGASKLAVMKGVRVRMRGRGWVGLGWMGGGWSELLYSELEVGRVHWDVRSLLCSLEVEWESYSVREKKLDSEDPRFVPFTPDIFWLR